MGHDTLPWLVVVKSTDQTFIKIVGGFPDERTACDYAHFLGHRPNTFHPGPCAIEVKEV